MKKTSTRKNFIWYYMYQFILLISPIITMPYVSRILGSENIGIYSFTFSIANYIYVFAQLGTLTYGVREIARNRDDQYIMSKTFFEIELMTVFVSIFCIIFYMIFLSYQKSYTIYFLLWTFFILSATFDITWFYIGIEHFEEIFYRNIFFRILGLISTFLFIKSNNDLWVYIIIYAFTFLLSNICMWTSLCKYIEKVNINELKILRHLKDSFIYFIPTIAASVYVILDKSILGFLVEDKRENGYYEMASQITTFGKSISSIVITRIFEPKTTYFYKNNMHDNIKKSIDISLNFTMFVSIGIICGILAVSDDFVPIFFGYDFLPVRHLIKLMSPLILITSITYVLEYEYLMPAGKRKEINYYVISGAIINFILNIVIIKYMKSIGAIITSLIAESIIMVLFFRKSDNYMPISTVWHNAKNKIIAGIIMIFIITILRYYMINIEINNTIKLILEILVGSLTYIICLIILKDKILDFKSNLSTI